MQRAGGKGVPDFFRRNRRRRDTLARGQGCSAARLVLGRAAADTRHSAISLAW